MTWLDLQMGDTIRHRQFTYTITDRTTAMRNKAGETYATPVGLIGTDELWEVWRGGVRLFPDAHLLASQGIDLGKVKLGGDE